MVVVVVVVVLNDITRLVCLYNVVSITHRVTMGTLFGDELHCFSTVRACLFPNMFPVYARGYNTTFLRYCAHTSYRKM